MAIPAAIEILAPFASAGDTARELGVSDATTQKLKALVVRFVGSRQAARSGTSIGRNHVIHYVARKAKWSAPKKAKKAR